MPKIISNDYLHYDVIIVDILLPKSPDDPDRDTFGFDLLELIFQTGYTKRLLIFTNEVKEAVNKRFPNVENVVFLNKSNLSGPEQLEEIVREIAQGNKNSL